MIKKPNPLTALITGLRVDFKISKDPNCVVSAEKIWPLSSQFDKLGKGYDAFGDCRDDLSFSDISQIVSSHQGTDKELAKKVLNADMEDTYLGHWSSMGSERISNLKELCQQPDALLSTLKAVFEDEQIKTFCEEHKKLILQGYFYTRIGEGFAQGLDGLVSFCKTNAEHLPEGTMTKLAEFMTKNPAFQVFFEDRRYDLDERGRKGRLAPTFLYDLVEATPAAEKKAVKKTFDRHPVFLSVLCADINHVEDENGCKVDQEFYLS